MVAICVDARMLSCSGIGTFLKNVIPFFSPEEIVLLIDKQDKEKIAWLKNYRTIVCRAPIYSIQEQGELPMKIPRCEWFWSPHYNIPLFPILAKKRMVTIHDVAHLVFKESQTPLQNLYAQMMFRQAVKRSDLVTTVSSFSQREIASFLSVPIEKIHVILEGIDTQRFATRGSATQLEQLRDKYQLPQAFLLFVGNLKPHKNLRLILEAYRTGKILLPLVVVGKKEGLLTVDPLVKERNDLIHFVGEVLDEEIPLFYQMASIFLFPSRYEGFGLPPLEAMASGCPVIASCCASIPEVCGDAAHLISADQKEELVDAIARILLNTEYRAQLIRKGYDRILQFKWEQTAHHYRQLLLHPAASLC